MTVEPHLGLHGALASAFGGKLTRRIVGEEVPVVCRIPNAVIDAVQDACQTSAR